MLKIHSFLQRVKKPLGKVVPNHIGRSRTSLAVMAYAMVTVLFLLSPDYLNGKGTNESNSLAKAETTQATGNIAGETANEAVVRIDPNYLSSQFLQNEQITESTPVGSLMSLQLNLVTNDMKNTNQVNSAKNDSKSEELLTKANEVLDTTKFDDANTDQANVNANEKVDSGSTKDKENKSTLSVSSTDKNTEDAKEKSEKKKETKKSSQEETSTKSESDQKENQSDKKSNVIGLSENEIGILQRIVEAEASGETIKGKMLVANVILNRVKNKNFPDTVEGVVFQRDGGTYQFSPIKDGRYYSVKVSSDTKKAVSRVLQGEDESSGALYFSARSKANKSSMRWFDSHLTFLFEYGGHEFFK